MTQPLRISVIVAVYNGVKHLDEQMDELLGQHCDFPWEALYVDNGSTDGSQALIQRRIAAAGATHIRLIDGSQKRGQVHARNIGVQQARADLLAFTDQDDLPAPDWLDAMSKALTQADAVGGFVVRTPDGNEPSADRNSVPPHDRPMLHWNGFDCAIGTNFAIRRQVLEAVGGWEGLDVHAGEDIDLSLRLHFSGYRLIYAPSARVTWRSRRGLGPLYRQAFSYGRGNVLLYRRYRHRLPSPRTFRQMLRTLRQAFASIAGLFRQPRSYLCIHLWGIAAGSVYESVRSRILYL